MNGIIKIPMQFFILLVGVLVFVYYSYNTSPLYFNDLAITKLKKTAYKEQIISLEQSHNAISEEKKKLIENGRLNHIDNIEALKELISKRRRSKRSSKKTD